MVKNVSRFEVLSVRKPGEKGTKRLLAKYGEGLKAVRYLRDKLTGERFKTVELKVDEYEGNSLVVRPDAIVGVKLAMHEKELRLRVKQSGGCWDPFDKVWLLKYEDLEELGLTKRAFTIREEPGVYIC